MSQAAPISGLPVLDKYELLEEIGHGGMATVYRARDPRLGREVAVKVIHKHLRENAEVGARFQAEARAAAKLHHPGIVEVFDVSPEDSLERYLVVELLRGATLRKVLQQHRDMPAEVGACIVLGLCDALEHAHESSIIHRDIKPENVLVELPQDRAAVSARQAADAERAGDSTPSPSPRVDRPVPPASPSEPGDTQQSERDAVVPGPVRSPRKISVPTARPAKAPDSQVVIKITDFGIAKILDAQGVTSTGQVLGSPAHMAPEQIEGGDVDARTDVFALGVLMYECLVGHLPFEGKNPAQVLRKVLEGTYPAADRERPAVGGRWSRLLACALARDPEARTPAPGKLAELIKAELDALGISDPRAEIEAYFADTKRYTAAYGKKLLPRLIARGEAARKAGDIPGAAADFNRALALAPDDLAALKRIASLTSSASRRLLLRRASAIAAGSVLIGFAAFGAARLVKRAARADPRPPASASGTAPDPPPSASIAAERPSAAVPSPPASSSAGASADGTSRRIKVPVAMLSAVPSAPPAQGERRVTFSVIPKGARLSVDGAPPLEWFGNVRPYSVGPHKVLITIEPSTCCKPFKGTVIVTPPPANDPQEVQAITLRMDFHPATVTLADAPPAGQLSCSSVGLTVPAGGSRPVKMNDAASTARCTFMSEKAPRQASINLRAGETTVVAWPPD